MKERNLMSEWEKEEFQKRMAVLTEEEQEIAVRYFKDEIMFSELEKRSKRQREIISVVENIIWKEGKPNDC